MQQERQIADPHHCETYCAGKVKLRVTKDWGPALVWGGNKGLPTDGTSDERAKGIILARDGTPGKRRSRLGAMGQEGLLERTKGRLL